MTNTTDPKIKNPIPIRYKTSDISAIDEIKSRLHGQTTTSALLRAAVALGVKQMAEMNVSELLAALREGEGK